MSSTGVSNLTRPILALLLAASGLLATGCAFRQVVSWRNYGDVEDEGGIWTAIALDAKNGILYRPIVSDIGYGGTRYGPLHVVLHAGLLKAGMAPVDSGFLIGVVTAAAALAGIYQLMRRLKVPASFAIALTSFFLSAFSVRSGILSIKADLLAAALDVWGLIAALPLAERMRDTCGKEFPPPLVLRGRAGVGAEGLPSTVECRSAHETPTLTLPRSTRGGEEEGLQNVSRTLAERQQKAESRRWPAILLAGTCFALAAASKVTSLFGIATVVTWLLLRGEMKIAARLVGVFCIGVIAAALAVQWASGGRAMGVFAASAAAGGGLRRLAQAPLYFFPAIFSRDRVVGGFWIAALVMLLTRRNWRSLPTILLGYSTLGTLAIFGSRGTDMNHLMDLHLASLVVLAVACQSGGQALHAGWIARFVLLVIAAISLHAAHSCLNDVDYIRQHHPRATMNACLADAAASPVRGPLFAENPMLPILAGERPYVLDCFLFSVIDLKHPSIGDKLRDDLAHQRFRAVIVTGELTHNTMPTPTDPWPQFLILMRTRYELKATEGRNLVYLPKMQ